MLKKILKGLVAGGALLGMVATAQAATYDINIYGASAQHKFWLNLADEWLLDSTTGPGCASVVKANYDKKHGVSVGTNCTVDGSSGHTINFRYSSQSSMVGVAAVQTGASKSMVDVSTCTFPTYPSVGTCTGLTATVVNLGASDVGYDDFNQSTEGYPDGNLEVDVYSGAATTSFPLEAQPPQPDGEFNPIIVPFGFIVNDTVCKFRCVKPHVWQDVDGNQIDGPVTAAAYAAIDTAAHKAYSHDMWECDPTLSNAAGNNEQCIGYYKCIDTDGDGTETCQGGVNNGLACTSSEDCPDVALEDTRCEAMPLDNINTTMAGLIFSGTFKDWSDFGPYFDCAPEVDTDVMPGAVAGPDDTAIFAAMRHAGSGTHATVSDLLAPYALSPTDDYTGNLMVGDASYPKGYNRIHYESSSDLTAAVADFAGGIGYVDADKLLTFKDLVDGIADGPTAGYDEADGIIGAHLVKYNGVEPTAQKIINCEYEFWSPQHCYYMDGPWSSDAMAELLTKLSSFSSNANNLTYANLGAAANFWTAQSSMTKCWKVKKDGVSKYIIQ